MANIASITTSAVDAMTNIMSKTRSEKIAEYTSPCPDLPIKFHISVESAKEAMASLLIMATIIPERAGLPKMYFTDHLARMCYNYNYEGEWAKVQEILELRTLSPYNIVKLISGWMSAEDFYGNFVPLCSKLARTARIVRISYSNNRKVKKPQRKRGYDDKGTLRLSHTWLPTDVHLGANPVRVDRRDLSHTPRSSHHWKNDYYRRKQE